MIQLEEIAIAEFRGIRSLTLKPRCKNFVIYGPNGSGKSGVVDAIQFGLTGKVSRLIGRGTGSLSFQKYGPHVDSRENLADVEVSLTLYLPTLNKTVTLKRNGKSPGIFALDPDDSDARVIIEQMARHPELTLSRREIIKYILVEAGRRAEQVQALLNLEAITNLRQVILKAKNQADRKYNTKQSNKENALRSLLRHFDLREMLTEEMLEAINEQRKVLSLSPIAGLDDGTTITVGIDQGEHRATFNKETALRDIDALSKQQTRYKESEGEVVTSILDDITTLENDPSLLVMLQRRSLIESGLSLVEGPLCPLCDKEWEDEEHLREHLQNKIIRSKEAERIQKGILDKARLLGNQARNLVGLIAPVKELALSDSPERLSKKLVDWEDDLKEFTNNLSSVEGILRQQSRIQQDWMAVPDSLVRDSNALRKTISEKPDQSNSNHAHSFLVVAKERFAHYHSATLAEVLAERAANLGRIVYKSYLKVSENRLKRLYETVENDFSDYYRALNGADESGFTASLEPDKGKLNLNVAFYNRGQFPPSAYHSEGHQDGMGVCLFLALMKQLLGDHFNIAVLDDVVMSIDRQHRKQLCRLLEEHFPDTQFVITTHDRVWAKQMEKEGVVESRENICTFHGWSVEDGPVHGTMLDVWDQLSADLTQNNVGVAAGRLRRHLEYTFGELAGLLVAQVPYKADCSYSLGNLRDAVIGRHYKLLALATKSAKSWGNIAEMERVRNMKEKYKEAVKICSKEDWLVNKSVHYNEFADFSVSEFRDTVEAYKNLLQQFQCPTNQCKSLLYVSFQGMKPDTLRCRCAALCLNLM